MVCKPKKSREISLGFQFIHKISGGFDTKQILVYFLSKVKVTTINALF